MTRPTKQNPYCEFKDDRERRVALNVRARWRYSALMVAAVASVPINWTEKIRWVTNLLH